MADLSDSDLLAGVPLAIPLRSRDDLLSALATAAEMEHMLLCQYLFAGLTLKRSTAEGLTEVEVEQVRRWGSGIMFVARQEMEHLGIVFNLTAAIGGAPILRRANFPQAGAGFGTPAFLQLLTPLDADTIGRFVAYESPHPAPGPGYCQAGQDAAANRAARRDLLDALDARAAAELTSNREPIAPPPVAYDSIQQLYLSIREGLQRVCLELGSEALFIGPPSQQIFGGPGSPDAGGMNDLNQYGLDVVRVTDLPSAIAAVDLILEQGEGLFGPPTYREHTHFCIFSRIQAEMAAVARPGFSASRPVVPNPMTAEHPEVSAPGAVLLTKGESREVAVVFNRVYVLMLEMLLWLYAHPRASKVETDMLTDTVFFPLMTMFIRPLAEMLSQMPAFAEPDRPGNAGPGFELFTDVVAPVGRTQAFPIFGERLDALAADLGRLSLLRSGGPLAARALYLHENMTRLAADWRAKWQNIGRDA